MGFQITEKDRREWAEMKRAWPIVVIFFLLLSSREVVGHFWGKGWAVVAGIFAVIVWLTLRPWRMFLLHPDSRRTIYYSGTIILCGWAIIDALHYWKH